jgi:hypothetical protein
MKYVLLAFVMAVTPVFASNDVFTGTRIPPLPGECAQSDNTSYFDGALWMSSVDGHWEIYANQYTCSGTNFMWLLLPVDTEGRLLDRGHLPERHPVGPGYRDANNAHFLILDSVMLPRPRKGLYYTSAGCELNKKVTASARSLS